ncbi:hypothetical protein PRUPE_5G016700 [Prunus persica]|uniref:Uncharacterized protein n=1 Tax=Prunus persica TaxID=3760 RepID=A0A251P213_PRUPE|nr:hypothetical protein PRUPE_5G016700 [Prunus persica]
MAAVRSSSSLVSNPVYDQCSDQGSRNKSEPLIPGLPDDIAELCLHYLPSPIPTKLWYVQSLLRGTEPSQTQRQAGTFIEHLVCT